MLDAKTIPKYRHELTLLPVAAPQEEDIEVGQKQYYKVKACAFYQQMLPEGYPKTFVWGFEGACYDKDGDIRPVKCSPGPSFYMERYLPAVIEWENALRGSYQFHVDPTIEWANPRQIKEQNPTAEDFMIQFPVPIVMHLHGGEVPSVSDGHPRAWYTFDGLKGPKYVSNRVEYPNQQPSATLWYHDHTQGVTRLNQYSGLMGGYVIQDLANPLDQPNNPYLPSGVYDVLIVIQDRSFCEDGSLYYPETGEVDSAHPYWVSSYLGDAIVVNGKVWPKMSVETNMYRFRLVNASNARTYTLHLSNDQEMIQIATDGGYLKNPVILSELTLAPGERSEVLIDFSTATTGDRILLQNIDANAKQGTTDQVLQFLIYACEKKREYQLPATLSSFPNLTPTMAPVITTIHEGMNENSDTLGLLFDGQRFLNPASNFIVPGATFYWRFINAAVHSQPIHLHLIQCLIVARQKVDMKAYLTEWIHQNGDELPLDHSTKHIDPEAYLVESETGPYEYETGWKDTFVCPPGYMTTVLIRVAPIDAQIEAELAVNEYAFDPCLGPGYVFHSSIPEAEDNAMIREQFFLS